MLAENHAVASDELQLIGLSKRYPGVQALDDVSLSVEKGTIHALAGQNGAGKSTLVKILSGAEAPDHGAILLGGREHTFSDPHAAQAAGIQTIYQELSLVPQLSVAENICLGHLPLGRGRKVDWQRMREEARQALAQVGFDLDVDKPVGSYSVAEQQGVELAKAIRKRARVLLLDEPTSALPQPDVVRLFEVLRNLAKQGVTLLYISHRMDEIYSICSHVTVLRDGRKVATLTTSDSEPRDIIAHMVGRKSSSLAQAAIDGAGSGLLGNGGTDQVLMKVDNLSAANRFRDVSFELREGEVLGLCGLVGSGQSDLASVLAGAREHSTGTIRFLGETVRFSSPREAIRLGIGLLPQDRKAHGFVPEMSVARNITLASLPMFSRSSIIDERKEKSRSRSLAERLAMRISGVDQPMGTLSGGTQQKAILARWLVRSARLLICDEPTRGVDVEAKEEMYELLREFVRSGGTVIIASSEISEAKMCDRVLVMAKGHVVAELPQGEIDAEGRAIMERFG